MNQRAGRVVHPRAGASRVGVSSLVAFEPSIGWDDVYEGEVQSSVSKTFDLVIVDVGEFLPEQDPWEDTRAPDDSGLLDRSESES